jgi:hypothetical protein
MELENEVTRKLRLVCAYAF